jgi:hypothetical protein
MVSIIGTVIVGISGMVEVDVGFGEDDGVGEVSETV